MIDEQGYRHGVSVVLVNKDNKVFWAKRIRQVDAWQFPQGGLQAGESYQQALFRELHEEVGLKEEHVQILAQTKQLLSYRLPYKFIRKHSQPLCIGQSHQWFLLKLKPGCEQYIYLEAGPVQEFDAWRWVDYHEPLKKIISFKQSSYEKALKEFEPWIVGINELT